MVDMKVMFFGNCPWTTSGYSNNIRNIVLRLKKQHEVAVQCNWGLTGGPVQWNGITCYPTSTTSPDSARANFAELEKNAKKWGADISILHYDVWTNNDQLLTTTLPFMAYGTVDGYPVSPLIIDGFKNARKVISANEWEKKVLKADYDMDSVVIPYGIDPTIYYPATKDKEKYKQKFGVVEPFLFSAVGRNVGPRKGFAETMEAYGNFLAKNPSAVEDTRLYLHTDYMGAMGGYNLYNLCQLYGIAGNVTFTASDSFESLTDDEVADLYRASDVLMNCSHGEGFGKPILEALACGVPVIATDATSMTELVKGHGQLVRPSGRVLQNQNYTYHALPFVPDIVKAMETYYRDWRSGGKLLKEHGDDGAKMAREKYNWDDINNKWVDMLKDYEEEVKKENK